MPESQNDELDATFSRIAVQPNLHIGEVLEGAVQVRTIQPVVPYLADQFSDHLSAGESMRLALGFGDRDQFLGLNAYAPVFFANGLAAETILSAVEVGHFGHVDKSPTFQVRLRCLGQVKLHEAPGVLQGRQDPDPDVSYRTAYLVESAEPVEAKSSDKDGV